MDKMNIDLEKLDRDRQIAIKLIALQEGDIIIDKDGERRVVDEISFHPLSGWIGINGSYFNLEGDWFDSIDQEDEFNGNEIVDVIFADRGK